MEKKWSGRGKEREGEGIVEGIGFDVRDVLRMRANTSLSCKMAVSKPRHLGSRIATIYNRSLTWKSVPYFQDNLLEISY